MSLIGIESRPSTGIRDSSVWRELAPHLPLAIARSDALHAKVDDYFATQLAGFPVEEYRATLGAELRQTPLHKLDLAINTGGDGARRPVFDRRIVELLCGGEFHEVGPYWDENLNQSGTCITTTEGLPLLVARIEPREDGNPEYHIVSEHTMIRRYVQATLAGLGEKELGPREKESAIDMCARQLRADVLKALAKGLPLKDFYVPFGRKNINEEAAQAIALRFNAEIDKDSFFVNPRRTDTALETVEPELEICIVSSDKKARFALRGKQPVNTKRYL